VEANSVRERRHAASLSIDMQAETVFAYFPLQDLLENRAADLQ